MDRLVSDAFWDRRIRNLLFFIAFPLFAGLSWRKRSKQTLVLENLELGHRRTKDSHAGELIFYFHCLRCLSNINECMNVAINL